MIFLAQTDRVASVTGDLRIHESFASRILGNRRTLRVWLPPKYASEPRKRFDLLVMLDGQNLFDGRTSFLPNQEWRVDETLTELGAADLIDPPIVVGVDNAGADRGNEYLPSSARMNDVTFGGRLNEFGRFLTDEVLPFVHRTYRTRRGAGATTIGGSSFGGVAALTLGLRRPDAFGRVMACSTSVWWNDREILRNVAKSKRGPRRIWLDNGALEGPEGTRLLAQELVKIGYRRGHDLVYYEGLNDTHNELAWARRFPLAAEFLYRRR